MKKKRMDDQERAALDAFQAGDTAPKIVRQAMGVLRRLWPECAEQIRPRRGRVQNPDLVQLVRNRYDILTNTRFRDDQLKRPLTTQEAITRIAEQENISEGHVRKLVAPVHAIDKKLAQEAAVEQQRQLEAAERQLRQHALKTYEDAFRSRLSAETLSVSKDYIFDNAIHDAHIHAVKTVHETLGLDRGDIPNMVWDTRSKLRAEYECRRRERNCL